MLARTCSKWYLDLCSSHRILRYSIWGRRIRRVQGGVGHARQWGAVQSPLMSMLPYNTSKNSKYNRLRPPYQRHFIRSYQTSFRSFWTLECSIDSTLCSPPHPHSITHSPFHYYSGLILARTLLSHTLKCFLIMHSNTVYHFIAPLPISMLFLFFCLQLYQRSILLLLEEKHFLHILSEELFDSTSIRRCHGVEDDGLLLFSAPWLFVNYKELTKNL